MLSPVAHRRSLVGQLLLFGLWVGVTGFGVALSPATAGHGTHQELGLPPCPCVIFFDRPCPGCGLTTSWTALLHGRFRESLRAHWLGPALYLAFTAAAFAALWGFASGRKLTLDSPAARRWVTIGAIVFFAYGIGRFCLLNHYGTPYEGAFAAGIRARR